MQRCGGGAEHMDTRATHTVHVQAWPGGLASHGEPLADWPAAASSSTSESTFAASIKAQMALWRFVSSPSPASGSSPAASCTRVSAEAAASCAGAPARPASLALALRSAAARAAPKRVPSLSAHALGKRRARVSAASPVSRSHRSPVPRRAPTRRSSSSSVRSKPSASCGRHIS